ncbi:MAG: hypothetical protein KA313_11370 [Pseudarcicella sp.]|nr:hypothetical protein [Pseudarcicella sp.]
MKKNSILTFPEKSDLDLPNGVMLIETSLSIASLNNYPYSFFSKTSDTSEVLISTKSKLEVHQNVLLQANFFLPNCRLENSMLYRKQLELMTKRATQR